MDEKEQFIVEVFDLLTSKIKRGDCTKQQYDSMADVVAENLPLWATSDEIADHFGKTKSAVFSIIKNKMLSKPKKNITMYNFKEFCRRVPASWKKRR